MSNSSILGGERAAARARGRDADSLGPSDSSDSGSDVQGERATPVDASDAELGTLPVRGSGDSDSFGTGERGSATGDDAEDGADILPDRIATDPVFAADVSDQINDLVDADVNVEDLAEGGDDDEDEDIEGGEPR